MQSQYITHGHRSCDQAGSEWDLPYVEDKTLSGSSGRLFIEIIKHLYTSLDKFNKEAYCAGLMLHGIFDNLRPNCMLNYHVWN